MGDSSLQAKPGKPYKDFPLYPHGNGQWAKKIKGKTYFFGTWENWEAALNTYLDDRDVLQAGRHRKRDSNSPTLQELVNVYIDHCKNRVASREMSQRTINDYTRTLKRLAVICGNTDTPGAWTPDDFSVIKEAFHKPVQRVTPIRGGVKGVSVERRSSITVDIDIRAIRAFLNWCYESEYISQPRFGLSFNQTSAKQKRKQKSSVGPRDLSSADIRAYINHASTAFKGIVLLGINAGMGATDIGGLTIDNYKGEWLDCARQKTAVARRIWLWPETRNAIDEHLSNRPKRLLERRLFVTTQLNAWVRSDFDAIGRYFGKIRDEHGLRGSFYDLRRTFQTIAEETLDFPAVQFVMGHAASNSDMSAVYRQKISEDRIKKVCGHVRNWLWGNQVSSDLQQICL